MGVYIYMKIKGKKTYSSYQLHFKCSPYEEAFNTGLKIGKHLTCSKRGERRFRLRKQSRDLEAGRYMKYQRKIYSPIYLFLRL